MNEEEMRGRIKRLKKELLSAGPIHKRDLLREIHHLQKELRIYAFYQAQAARATKKAG